jgi:AbrB family looped-hinge helix DNA binding protein
MTQLAIRQSGGANIVSIPKAVLKSLGLGTGSSLDLSIENDKIVLTPVRDKTLTLESLLAGSPADKLALNQDDKDWLNASPVGREAL